MRSKTLMAVAVAGTFGWASAAHAGPGHHASSMADEAHYPSTVMLFDSDGMGTIDSSAAAALSDGTYSEYYLVSWTPGGASGWDNYVIEPSSDMRVLLDDGASTVSMAEVMASNSNTIVLLDGAGYELIPASDTIVLFDPATYGLTPLSSDTLVLLDDEAYVVSTYEVILLPSDFTQAGGS